MQPDVEALWHRYAATSDAATREQLILHYAPLVKYVAGRVAVGMPSHVEHSELMSYGILGLIDAIEKFDVSKGFKFETYAVTRVKGAIMDELRKADWVPRTVRRKARELTAAVQHLEAQLHRSPSEEEIASELGWSIDELHDTLTKTSMTSVVALDEMLDVGEGDSVSLGDTLQDINTVLPEDSYDDIETKKLLRQAMRRLTEREQTVLALYYFEGMTLSQVGDVLGVTESRVCQIHTKAVLSLRAKLSDRTYS